MSQVFKAAQPALLYLVPFTLFPLFGMAWLKVDFKIFVLYYHRNFHFRAISGQCGQTRSCMFLQPSTRPSEIWADQTCSARRYQDTKYQAIWSDQVCSTDIKIPSTRQSEIWFDQACSTVIKIEAIWDIKIPSYLKRKAWWYQVMWTSPRKPKLLSGLKVRSDLRFWVPWKHFRCQYVRKPLLKFSLNAPWLTQQNSLRRLKRRF